MPLPQEGCLLRIFIAENDKFQGKVLYEWILRRALESGLAGATVLRGLEGFGTDSHLHTSKILRLSSDLPVVVEIVDSQEKIEAFLPVVDKAVTNGLVTVEDVKLRVYRKKAKSEAGE